MRRPPTVLPVTSHASDTHGLYDATRVASVPADVRIALLEHSRNRRRAPQPLSHHIARRNTRPGTPSDAAPPRPPPSAAMRSIDFSVDRFRVVEEPVQAGKRDVAVHLLEHVERATDGFVVCRMHAPWPAVLREHAHDAFEFAFHLRQACPGAPPGSPRSPPPRTPASRLRRCAGSSRYPACTSTSSSSSGSLPSPPSAFA